MIIKRKYFGINFKQKSMKRIFTFLIVSAFIFTAKAQITVEFETGTLTGTQVENSAHGYTGTGYVNGFDNDGDKATVTFNIPTTGTYKLAIRYSAGSYKEQKLLANGVLIGKILMPETQGFANLNAGGLFFNAGQNSITIEKDWGWILLDNITLTLTSKHDYNVTSNLIDPAASYNTNQMWQYLKDNFGKKIISGQTAYYNQLVAVAGKSPKQRAFDFQSYTQGYTYKWQNGGHVLGWHNSGITEDIINWYNSTNGCGLVSVQWHWHSPSGGLAGTNSFYTAHSTFDVSKAVTFNTPEYNDIIEDIDSIATQLKKLQKANIPVLWRPIHEAGGAWFWWGAKGAAPALALWDIVQNRLMNHHKINNLIWVWSTPEESWYPGNSKVDVIGYDSYPGAFNYSTQKNIFDQLYEMVEGQKIVAMTENGPIPDIDQLKAQDAMWSYFSSWDDLVVEQNSTQHIKDVFAHDLVVTQDDPCGLITGNNMDLVENESFEPYPNPTQTAVTLYTNSLYSVHNSLGAELFQGQGITVDLSKLKPGMYLIKANNRVFKVQKI